jgi:hypothetical protein
MSSHGLISVNNIEKISSLGNYFYFEITNYYLRASQ